MVVTPPNDLRNDTSRSSLSGVNCPQANAHASARGAVLLVAVGVVVGLADITRGSGAHRPAHAG